MKWLLGSFLACVASAGAIAQEAPGIDFPRWSAMCRATAHQPASPLAQNIAAVASRERDLFKGHVIGAAGRVVQLGQMETDTGGNGGSGNRSDIPWANVQRYWNGIAGAGKSPDSADEAQSLSYYSNHGDEDRRTLQKKDLSLRKLLRVIRQLDLPGDASEAEAVREALRQSAIRASIADVPWSAAFVSSVLGDAGVSTFQFKRSAKHMSYITDAVKRSLADLDGQSGEDLYRACDPFNTRIRIGELLCYGRDAYSPGNGLTLHRSLMRDIAAGIQPISLSHCEIVVEVDHERKKIRTVGGNVQQSVTERTLNLNREEYLSTSQGKSCGDEDADGTARRANCSLNDRPWFVLLQVR